MADDHASGRRELSSIGELIDGVIAGIGGGAMTPMLAIRKVWHEVAGEHWAEQARPVQCDGTSVVVEVKDGAAASMFRYETRRIGKALGEAVGSRKPLMIRVRVARSRPGRAP
jgi:Dna[CI] antecedent, DciA